MHLPKRFTKHFVGLLALLCLNSFATQAQWDVSIFMQPFPSPYLSDWEHNPTIGSLTITNNTSSQTDILIFLTISRNSSVIATGNSNPISTLPGVPTQVNSDRFIDWNTVTYNTGLRDQAVQTGRLSEGEYNACVTVKDPGGAILAPNVCAPFTIVYPSPPSLFFPADGDSLTSSYPVFTWTPVQVPPAYQLHYNLKIVEVLPGQTPHQALDVNVVQYDDENLSTTNIQYPISALPLDHGKTYAWQVQAVDQNGFPPSGNEGRSEIWTFAVKNQSSPSTNNPSGGLRGRIVFYDPATETPAPLFAGIDTVSFESFSTRLEGASELLIPIPCPRDAAAPQSTTPAPIELPGLKVGSKNTSSVKSFALYARLPGDKFNEFLGNRGVPTWNHPNSEGGVDFLLAVVWPGSGLPQITFTIKPRMNLLSAVGLSTDYAFFILDPLGSFIIDSDNLPEDFGDFYGSNKIPVTGPNFGDALQGKGFKNLGINFYAVLDLGTSTAMHAIATWAEVDQLKVILQGFLGLGRGERSTLVGIHSNSSGASESSTKWFLRATIPAKVRDFLKPYIKSRRLTLEVGRNDSTFIDGMKNYADHLKNKVFSKLSRNKQTRQDSDSTMKAIEQSSFDTSYGYRLGVTDVITVSDDVMNAIDNNRILETGDSLTFFTTYSLEANGTPKSLITGSPTFSLTYGSNVTLSLFRNTLKIHSPFIRFNLNERSVSLAATFGIATEEVQAFDDFGIALLKVEKIAQEDTNSATPRPNIGQPTVFQSGSGKRRGGVWTPVSTEPPALPQKPLKSYMVEKEQPAADIKAPRSRKWRFQATLLINQQKTIAAALKLGSQLGKKMIGKE